MLNLSGKIILGYFIANKLLKNENKDTNNKNIPLPSFRNIIEVKHFLPGRIRIYTPKLINNENEKKYLLNQLINIDGINDIKINTITGSILVYYDINKVDCGILYSAIIKLLDLEQYINKKEKSLILKELHEASTALNRAIYEKTNGILDVKTLIPISLVLLAIKEYYTNPKLIKPSFYSLLWWAYNTSGLKGGA